MHSLAQKRFLAKKDGKNEVVLTMEEAEAILAQISELDQTIAKFMDYVPEEIVAEAINCPECKKHPYECECE